MKFSTVLFVGIVLCLFFWFFPQTKVGTQKIVKSYAHNDSTVLIDHIETKQQPKHKAQEKKANKNQRPFEIAAEYQNTIDGIENESKVSGDFVTAYRDWLYFETCYTDVEDFRNNKDPLDTLAERFALNPRESQQEATDQQNFYYQQHVEVCKALMLDENDDYHATRQKLKQKFEQIKPETLEEKQLFHALSMIKQLEVLEGQHIRAQYDKSTLPSDEIYQMNAEIKQLTAEMMSVYDSAEELTQEQIQLVKNYSEQIESMRLQLLNSQELDKQAFEQAVTNIDGYINSIDDYLHHVESPDAFIILAEAIYKSRFYQNQSTVSKRLQAETGINDRFYLEILNDIVIPLVSCSMGYPCDAESDKVISYCLGLRDSMFNQACGLNLEDFFFNHYIGPNQLMDVNNYFNYLAGRYAK